MKYAIAAAVFLAVAVLFLVFVHGLLHGMHLSHVKRAMADMRTIGTAWDALARDRGSYVIGRPGAVSYDELQRALAPKYLKIFPQRDIWGNAFEFSSSERKYSIRSLGRDGLPDRHTVPGETTNFDCDILYANGAFVSYPEGTLTR